jgi:hypothetical protein
MQYRESNRRQFVILLAASAWSLLPSRRLLAGVAARRPGEHPEPRSGVDGSRVLGADQVPPDLATLYDSVRRIPQVVDGIRCHCGCAGLDGFYSLLTCYEASGMALHCDVCQGEGRLTVRMHAQGRDLDQIRAAIDRRFG